MPIALDPSRDALGLIDVQPTFMPGGALATPDGDAVVAPINRLLWERFAFKFASQDWHPPVNVTFASSHAGRRPFEQIETDHGPLTLWPDHAIQGTPDAELHPEIKAHALDIVIRKGAGKNLEGYSVFSDLGGRLRSGLAPMLRDRGIKRVFLTGLALDICVAASAEDAISNGFETFIVEDACRASQPRNARDLKTKLTGLGIRFVLERDVTHPSSPA